MSARFSKTNFPESPAKADAADDNFNPGYAGCVAKLGWTITVVEFPGAASPEVIRLAGFNFGEILGDELDAASLGRFDSLKRGDPFALFFYLDTKSLPAGLEFLRSKLESLQILHMAKIASAHAAQQCWNVFHLPKTHEIPH